MSAHVDWIKSVIGKPGQDYCTDSWTDSVELSWRVPFGPKPGRVHRPSRSAVNKFERNSCIISNDSNGKPLATYAEVNNYKSKLFRNFEEQLTLWVSLWNFHWNFHMMTVTWWSRYFRGCNRTHWIPCRLRVLLRRWLRQQGGFAAYANLEVWKFNLRSL